MTHARSLTFTAITFALLVSACSQPNTVRSPKLEPQFGTTYSDSADAVVNDPERGYVYVAGVAATNLYEDGGRVIYLRRYNQNGSLAWERRTSAGRYDPGSYPDIYFPLVPFVSTVKLDGAGNAHLSWTRYLDGRGFYDAYVSKLNPAGKLLHRIPIDNGIEDLEVDTAGNVYVAGLRYTENPVGANERYFLRKYDARGRLVWERARTYDDEGLLENPGQTIAAPKDIGLASDGSLYVAGVNGGSSSGTPDGVEPAVLTKYSNDGVILWEQAGSSGVLTASGQNFYLASRVRSPQPYAENDVSVQKYNASGSIIWQRTIAGNEYGSVEPNSLAVDANGSVYLAGSMYVYREGDGNADRDFFARKYTASGGLSWTYQPRLRGTRESAQGVSAKASGNVYVVGATDAKINGNNFGGYDAFLLRLNGQGQKVWSR